MALRSVWILTSAVLTCVATKVPAEQEIAKRLIEPWRLTLCWAGMFALPYQTGEELRTNWNWRVEGSAVYFDGGQFAKYLSWQGTTMVERCILSLEMERRHDGRRLVFEIGLGGCVLNGVQVQDPTDVELFLDIIRHMITSKDELDWFRACALNVTASKAKERAAHHSVHTNKIERRTSAFEEISNETPGVERGQRDQSPQFFSTP